MDEKEDSKFNLSFDFKYVGICDISDFIFILGFTSTVVKIIEIVDKKLGV